MHIFSADTLGLLVTDIFLEEEITHFFSGNLSTGTYLATCYQFWLSKMYNKK